jgi:WhiB family redox-sensing transcriptional regulator
MSSSNRRCTNCGTRAIGRLCAPCRLAHVQAPIPPCIDCGSPLHRRSTPLQDRVTGSRFFNSHGRCTHCLKEARLTGAAPPAESKTMVKTPQPRYVVKAKLSLEERADALCTQIGDPELWFPEIGGTNSDAKAICQECPIRARCLDVALTNNERFGIFGGLSEAERANLRAERRKAAA